MNKIIFCFLFLLVSSEVFSQTLEVDRVKARDWMESPSYESRDSSIYFIQEEDTLLNLGSRYNFYWLDLTETRTIILSGTANSVAAPESNLTKWVTFVVVNEGNFDLSLTDSFGSYLKIEDNFFPPPTENKITLYSILVIGQKMFLTTSQDYDQ